MSRVKTLLVAIILVVGILFPTTGLANPGVTVSISDVTLATGATGSVALTITGAVESVSCIDVDVSYDPAVVEVIDASGSDFDSLVSNIQNGDGHTHLVAFVTSETGLTGTIKVADITLTRLGGESNLTLNVITLKDDDGNSLAYDVHNGRVSGTAIGLTVSIGEITLASGATGSVAVTISGAAEPVSCTTIDVSYAPAVVEVIDASGSDFSSLVDNIQNNLGYTRLVAYVSETGLTGTIKVADITLKRLAGESDLTLDVITLKDDDGNPMPFTVVNGRVIAERIGISVSPGSIDFGSILAGESSEIKTVTVTNTGNVVENFTASLKKKEKPPGFYTANLKIDDMAVSTWLAESVAVDATVTPGLVLTMPSDVTAGTKTATIIFTAEKA